MDGGPLLPPVEGGEEASLVLDRIILVSGVLPMGVVALASASRPAFELLLMLFAIKIAFREADHLDGVIPFTDDKLARATHADSASPPEVV